MHADDGTEISQPATETVSAKLTVTPAIGIRGDLDGSGTVGVGDIEEILKLMASGENNPAADLDGSGSVGVGDIEEILKIMAGA
jgi:hypothetical protein